MKTKILIIILLLAAALILSGAAGISVGLGDNWALTINSSNLQSGAGSDLVGTYESASNQIGLQVTAFASYRVDIKKSDSTWDSDFLLYAKRTSDGNGAGSVSGGTSYQLITDTDQSFFSGNKNRNLIDVQLKLSGVSVSIPANTYTTTVTYTVTDI